MSRLRSDKLVNKNATGAPELTYGATVPSTGTISGAGSINLTGIVTATTFSGNLTGNVTGNLTGTASTATAAATAYGLSGTPNITVGTVTGNLTGNVTGNVTGNATGLSGSPNIVVSSADVTGIGTINDLRLESVSDKITVSTGNSPTLAYDTGGGNVAVVYNASGPITLTVTGIPTTSDFNNRSINFSVIVRQGATGYGCSSLVVNGVTFNSTAAVGVSTRISYPSGTVATASTSCYDFFNFIGINTTGSASTITNYNFISIKNGDFRFY